MFAKDWRNTPCEERDYNHRLVPGGDQAAMFDSLWVALLTDPRNENTSSRDVFSKSPTPRFTVKSEINDDEEQDYFSIFNTPTCGMGGRQVMLNTQQPENDGTSRDTRSRDIPPHLTQHEGHEEVREVPQYEQGLFSQRYQNLPPPPPPRRGGGGPEDQEEEEPTPQTMTMTMIEDIVTSAEKHARRELQIALSDLNN